MLKKFYTPLQAKIAMAISPFPETALAIAQRLDMDQGSTIKEIETMASEGSIFRITTADGPLFQHPNFIMGLYEWHVNAVEPSVVTMDDVPMAAMHQEESSAFRSAQPTIHALKTGPRTMDDCACGCIDRKDQHRRKERP